MSWGFSTLLVKKGMDIVLPLTHWKGCLQTINQFISQRAGTFFFFSHYFALFHFLSSSPKHLHYATTPSSLLHPLSHRLLSYLLLSLSQTCVCSPSIIFSTPFPEQRCMPEMETKKVMIQARLCWQSFLPACSIQSISFLFREIEDRGYWDSGFCWWCLVARMF